ncbi:hypothetical protein Goshw_001811 [Gossypium schwendimanii]|uniref:Pollen Ole e 1 allergen and extensin family protein n=1 Tax=Gossypium schwendimanii TaxID=34291 RepID=A0A7J9MME0_GOSSC|nr:hypothetical protein [Gossypium schwendimanii]
MPRSLSWALFIVTFALTTASPDTATSYQILCKPGAEVQIACNFRAFVPKTREQVSFSVNRTTDKHGVYRLEIPSVDGIACAEAAIASSCQASLVGTSSTSCNIPGHRSTTDQIAIKSRHPNLCIYSLTALSFRPSKRNVALCGK